MGNVDPVLFRNGTPEKVRAAVDDVYKKCSKYDNFMLSSGSDIPADAKWENIDAYFEATINTVKPSEKDEKEQDND